MGSREKSWPRQIAEAIKAIKTDPEKPGAAIRILQCDAESAECQAVALASHEKRKPTHDGELAFAAIEGPCVLFRLGLAGGAFLFGQFHAGVLKLTLYFGYVAGLDVGY